MMCPGLGPGGGGVTSTGFREPARGGEIVNCLDGARATNEAPSQPDGPGGGGRGLAASVAPGVEDPLGNSSDLADWSPFLPEMNKQVGNHSRDLVWGRADGAGEMVPRSWGVVGHSVLLCRHFCRL